MVPLARTARTATGSIPMELANMETLEVLYFSDNQLTGESMGNEAVRE